MSIIFNYICINEEMLPIYIYIYIYIYMCVCVCVCVCLCVRACVSFESVYIYIYIYNQKINAKDKKLARKITVYTFSPIFLHKTLQVSNSEYFFLLDWLLKKARKLNLF